MCRRGLACALLLLAGNVAPLSGQESEETLLRQIDSLVPLVSQAAVEAAAARIRDMEAARREVASRRQLDTIRVAEMTIITPREDVEDARALFEEVWRESYTGGFSAQALRDRTFTYQRAAYDIEEIPVDGVREQVVVVPWHSREQSKARIRNAVGRGLAAELQGTFLGAWAPGNPFTRRDPGAVYRELVVAGSVAVRRCLDGDVSSCTATLGLELGDDPATVWYTPEERRARVLAWAAEESSVRTAYAAELARCAELSTPDACDAFMQSRAPRWAPLPIYLRDTLVGLALARGGPGAWDRLLEDPAMSPGEALAHAAGMPLADLIAEWRAWIVDNRPEVHAGFGRSSALTLMWILLFAALAARSTRWRFD